MEGVKSIMVLVDVDIDATGQDGIVYRYISKGVTTTNTNFNAQYNSYDLYFNETVRRIQFPNTVTPTDYESSTQTTRPYFMFSGVTIPQGSTILDATLTFTIQTSSANFGATWTGKVYGRKTTTLLTPYGTDATGTGVFTRTNATAFGTFTVSGAPTSTAQTQKAVDIQATVQELVNTFDYNNDLMMFTLVGPTLPALPPTTVTPTATTQITAQIDAYEQPAGFTPNLTINYIVGALPEGGFILDPQTEKVTFGVVSDGTHDGIARAIADEFGVSESFKEDFSTYLNQGEADTAWVPQDTPDNQVDVTNDNYFFTVKRDGTNTSTSFDLGAGNVSDTMWVFRCKVIIGTPYVQTGVLSSGLNISLTDTDSSTPLGSENDLIQTGLINTIIGGGAQHAINNLDDGAGGSSTTGTTTGWVAGETIYIELKRESATSIRSTIYTDADYTILRDTITKTIPSTIVGLRFIKFGSATDVTGFNGTFTGTVDDIQFWDGVTVPSITVNNWMLRFKLDITNLDDGANAIDKRLYMLMTDEDVVSDSNNPQDSLGLLLRTDNAITNFSIIDTNGTSPISATADSTFATAPSVSTFFVEIKRTSDSDYEASLYPDNTFATPTETEVGSVSVNTVGLRYLKFMNESTLTGAGAIDGTIDDIEFTNIATAGVTKEFEFEVNALIEEVSPTWSYREHELNLSVPPASTFGVEVASPNRYETVTGPPGIANNYLFKTFRKSEITGSDIDITWEKTDTCSSCTSNTFRVVDGGYDKDSLTDFVPGAGSPTSKGAGVLGSFSSFTNHAEQTETITGINWGSSTEEFVTIFAFITDTNTSPFGTLHIKEMNVRGTDNGDNFKWEFLSPVVTTETTGTDQDAGYVNASLAQTSFICGNAVILEDDFATNANWTQVGTGTSVTGGEVQGWGGGAVDRRVYHDLVTPLDDNGWKAEFECEFSFFSTGFLSSNSNIFTVSDTQAGGATDQDLIGVRFGQSNDLNTFGIYVDDHTLNANPIAVNNTVASTGVRYFVRLERLSLTQVKMSVFTGGFDVTPFGESPTFATIPSTITGLRFVSSANNNNASSSRVLTGVLDNLLITGVCPIFTVDALIQSQGTCGGSGGGTTVVLDQIAGNSGLWTEVDGAGEIEIDLASSGVLEWNSLQGGGTTVETFAHRQIPNFSDDVGLITLRVKVDKISSNIPSGRFIIIQNNALHPNPSTGSSFQIALSTSTPAGSIFASISDGTNTVNTTPRPNFPNGTIKFLEAVYDPVGQTLTQNIYTDAGFSVHDTGSPVQVDASAISMTGLTFTHMLTSNVKNSGPARVVSADLDDFTVIVEACPTFTVDAVIQAQGDNGCNSTIFSDDFATAVNWTQIGTGVSVTGGEIQGWGADGADRRVVHDLVTPLVDKGWAVEFEFEFSAFSTPNGPAHDILVVTDTNGSSAVLQDFISVRFGGGNLNIFSLLAGDNTAIGSGVSSVTDIASINTRYFVRLERLSRTEAKLSIFTGGFDVTPFQTPLTLTVSSGIDGLQFISSQSNPIGGPSRTLTGIVDNLVLANICCNFNVDARLVVPVPEEFEVNALIQALGDNGQCPFPATELIYSRPKSTALASRLGQGTSSPFNGGLRVGMRVAGATHVGKGIEDIRVLGLRKNTSTVTGTLFATVRSQDDTVISMSTNTVEASTLPFGSGIDVTFTFDKKIVLQDGYRIQVEMPNCIGCDPNGSQPNVFWLGTSANVPTGFETTLFRDGTGAGDNPSYENNPVTGFSNGGVVSFTISLAEPAEQHGCAEVDAIRKGIDLEFDFTVDGLAFVPPAKLTLVNAIVKGTINKDFTVDSCIRTATFINFEVDACIQQNNNDTTFTVDGHVFILPVRNVLVDAIVRYAQGANPLGAIPDLIIRVLRENGVLTGSQIVDEIIIITSDPAEGISFRGKTSRIKNWISRLERDQLIQQDNSDPDWHETNWSLGPLGLPLP